MFEKGCIQINVGKMSTKILVFWILPLSAILLSLGWKVVLNYEHSHVRKNYVLLGDGESLAWVFSHHCHHYLFKKWYLCCREWWNANGSSPLPSQTLGRGYIMTFTCPATLGAIIRRPGLNGPGRLLQRNGGDDELVTAWKLVLPLTYPPSSLVIPSNMKEKGLCWKDHRELHTWFRSIATAGDSRS